MPLNLLWVSNIFWKWKNIKFIVLFGIPCCFVLAFATFSHFYITISQDYSRAKFWANVALEILKNNAPTSAMVRVKWIVNTFIMTWFVPLKDSSRNLFSAYKMGMKVGDFTLSMFALGLSTRIGLFAGENLSLISQSLEKNTKEMVSLLLKSFNTCLHALTYFFFASDEIQYQ